ncbi:alpha/beta fold hydrolase [Roseibium denhamense]|uniref:Pimeloyl-ACP methyl ester carboxylesterase n=1 Tax=Roseibium denhamense TaxID=76305 RepID=A0ABY1P8M6_9HYPH|nr:alpha/beta fold hydrolase [Roseibium denhamense]MTI04516.1 alpha/beta fold hydrolase [Roseibium denhamense]SMP28260.1 Pimeloyl-ACP methyl ester carboxylesterase [Roseibium denhamense]
MSGPIVFVPGLLCTETLFAPQIAAFSDRPIMVADHRNHDSVDEIAHSLLETAPARFDLVGLSMGGYIAMAVKRIAPERVSKLALLDTNSRADTADQTERREFMIELTRKKGFEKVPHLLFPGFVHADREEDEDLKSIVVDMARETGAEAFIRQQTALIGRIDSRPHLQEISCPTLVVVGDGDRLTPIEFAKEIHDLIPGSKLEILSGSGHLPTLETPGQATETLRAFLNDT